MMTCLLAGAAWWLGAAPQGLWPPLAIGSLLGTLLAAWRSRPRERTPRAAAAAGDSDSFSDFGTSSFYAGSDDDTRSSGDDSSCASTDSGSDSSSDCSDSSGGSDD